MSDVRIKNTPQSCFLAIGHVVTALLTDKVIIEQRALVQVVRLYDR